jgi:zinc protease
VLTLAFRGVSLKDPERHVLDVICDALAGLGGRLNTAIREEKGMAYDVGVYNEDQLDGGAIVLYVQTDATKLQDCREAMWKEIKRLCAEPLAKEELDGVKRHIAGMEASAMQNQGDLAQRLALACLYGQDAREVFGRREQIMAVTPEQVQAAAKKYFDAKRWVSAVVKPEEKK